MLTYNFFSADFPKIFHSNGVRNMEGFERKERIVEGFETNEALPYQLSLLFGVPGVGWDHICGATLINKKYAISAYHCFPRFYLDFWKKLNIRITLEVFKAVAGRYRHNDTDRQDENASFTFSN